MYPGRLSTCFFDVRQICTFAAIIGVGISRISSGRQKGRKGKGSLALFTAQKYAIIFYVTAIGRSTFGIIVLSIFVISVLDPLYAIKVGLFLSYMMLKHYVVYHGFPTTSSQSSYFSTIIIFPHFVNYCLLSWSAIPYCPAIFWAFPYLSTVLWSSHSLFLPASHPHYLLTHYPLSSSGCSPSASPFPYFTVLYFWYSFAFVPFLQQTFFTSGCINCIIIFVWTLTFN